MKRWVANAVAVTCILLSVPSASDAAVVISEIYSRGGTATSVYASNFVELYNPDATSWNLDGWSLQYSTPTSSSWVIPVTALSGQLAPGGSYLIEFTAGLAGLGGAALPEPDVTNATTVFQSSGGRLALVSELLRLDCARACAGWPPVIDLVAFSPIGIPGGSGVSADGPTPTHSIQRDRFGTQTYSNIQDFHLGTPTPISAVPLPATAWLMLSGLGSLAAFARRRRGVAGQGDASATCRTTPS